MGPVVHRVDVSGSRLASKRLGVGDEERPAPARKRSWSAVRSCCFRRAPVESKEASVERSVACIGLRSQQSDAVLGWSCQVRERASG